VAAIPPFVWQYPVRSVVSICSLGGLLYYARPNQSRVAGGLRVAPVIIACLVAASAAAQTAREVHGAAAIEPLQNEPPAKIIIDPPLAEPLSHGGW
jgi:Family of unknown function (DUF6130)